MVPIIDRHLADLHADFTLEFNVKSPTLPTDILPETWEYEWTTGAFTNGYAQKAFLEISRPGYRWLDDWSFAGRSNGWFVLLCKGSGAKVRAESIDRISGIVQRYYNAYGKELETYYKTNRENNI